MIKKINRSFLTAFFPENLQDSLQAVELAFNRQKFKRSLSILYLFFLLTLITTPQQLLAVKSKFESAKAYGQKKIAKHQLKTTAKNIEKIKSDTVVTIMPEVALTDAKDYLDQHSIKDRESLKNIFAEKKNTAKHYKKDIEDLFKLKEDLETCKKKWKENSLLENLTELKNIKKELTDIFDKIEATTKKFEDPASDEYAFIQKVTTIDNQNSEEVATINALKKNLSLLKSEKSFLQNLAKIPNVQRISPIDYRRKSLEIDPLLVDKSIVKKGKKSEEKLIAQYKKSLENIDKIIKAEIDTDKIIVLKKKKNDLLIEKIKLQKEQIRTDYVDLLQPKLTKEKRKALRNDFTEGYQAIINDYSTYLVSNFGEININKKVLQDIQEKLQKDLENYYKTADRREKLITGLESNLQKNLEKINEKDKEQVTPVNTKDLLYQTLSLHEQKRKIELIHPEIFPDPALPEGLGDDLKKEIKDLNDEKEKTTSSKQWNVPHILTIGYLSTRHLLEKSNKKKSEPVEEQDKPEVTAEQGAEAPSAKSESKQTPEQDKILDDTSLTFKEKFKLLWDLLVTKKRVKIDQEIKVLTAEAKKGKERETQRNALDKYKKIRESLEKKRTQEETALREKYKEVTAQKDTIANLEEERKKLESVQAKGQELIDITGKEVGKTFNKIGDQISTGTTKLIDNLKEGLGLSTASANPTSPSTSQPKQSSSETSILNTLSSFFSSEKNVLPDPSAAAPSAQTIAANQKPVLKTEPEAEAEAKKIAKEKEIEELEKKVEEKKEEQKTRKQKIEENEKQLQDAKKKLDDNLNEMYKKQENIHKYDRLLEKYSSEELTLRSVYEKSLQSIINKKSEKSVGSRILDKLKKQKEDSGVAALQGSQKENSSERQKLFKKITEDQSILQQTKDLLKNDHTKKELETENQSKEESLKIPEEAYIFEASRVLYEQQAIKNLYREFGTQILGVRAADKIGAFAKINKTPEQNLSEPEKTTPGRTAAEQETPTVSLKKQEEKSPFTETPSHRELIEALIAEVPQNKIKPESIGFVRTTFSREYSPQKLIEEAMKTQKENETKA